MFSDSREQKDCRQQWGLMYGCARRFLLRAYAVVALLVCAPCEEKEERTRLHYKRTASAPILRRHTANYWPGMGLAALSVFWGDA